SGDERDPTCAGAPLPHRVPGRRRRHVRRGARRRARRQAGGRRRDRRDARAARGRRRPARGRQRVRHALARLAAGMSIRIAIAEDQALVLGALSALLELEHDMNVVCQAKTGAEALAALGSLGADVLLTDIEMPGMSGLELAAAVRREHPAVRVIIVTTFGRAGYLRRALDAGVSGYLLKDAPASELANAIRLVHAGGRAVAPELAVAAWGEEDPWSERERQVLKLAGEGRSGAEIAAALHLSEGTVRNYLSEAIGKLGAANRIDAARIARRKGWL